MSDEKTETCCLMRRKTTVFLGPVIPEEVCGVSDLILADFMRFDMDAVVCPDGKKRPILGFKFCPWCGKPFVPGKSETRTTAFGAAPEEDESGEGWKKPTEWTPEEDEE